MAGLARLYDERVYDVDGDRTALVVGATLRWHVNVIAAPILAMALGSAALVPRLIASAIAVVLTVVLDGAGVFLYLWLGVRRLRGAPLLGAAVDDQLAYASAIARGTPIVHSRHAVTDRHIVRRVVTPGKAGARIERR